MKIELPTWAEANERNDQLEDTNRTTAQSVMSGHKLNPVEQFVYDYEPTSGPDTWRKSLINALENAFMCELL